MAATVLVAISGNDVPIAITVRPITVREIPNDSAIPTAPFNNQSALAMIISSPAITKMIYSATHQNPGFSPLWSPGELIQSDATRQCQLSAVGYAASAAARLATAVSTISGIIVAANPKASRMFTMFESTIFPTTTT